jgi:hypothetical protein
MLSAHLWQSQKYSMVARVTALIARGTAKTFPCRK